MAAILRGPAAPEDFESDEEAGELDADCDSEDLNDELEVILESENEASAVGEDASSEADPSSSAPGGSPSALGVAALLEELQEKDALVAALTSQLEEAADRLDRLHRAGAGRLSGGTTVDAGRPEGNPELVEEIGRLTAAWDQLRAGEALGEISRKLDDLYDALSRPGVTMAPRESNAAAGAAFVPEASSPRVAWEDMKAQLLRDEAGHVRAAEAPLRTVDGNDSSADVLSQIPLDPPAAVDLEIADRETLIGAVEDRDVFISHLIRRLRSGPAGRYEPIDWSALAGAPDELRERLQELEARLQELLRMEECDLSLERARLARERARLEQLRREVERDSRVEAAGLNGSGEDTSHSERRWLRAFGFGRKESHQSE